MATSVISAFEKFRQNLEITDLQSSTVSTRHTAIRNHMATELTVQDDFLSGSYSRSTMIAPLNKADIDIFVVLDSSYFPNYKNSGQATLLDSSKEDSTPKIYPFSKSE